MGMVHGITESLPTIVHFSVVLLGVVLCSRQVVEACAPRSYGSPEGEECLQYAGLRSKVSVVAVSGLRAGCVCLLLNGLMLRQIVLGPVQISESLFDRRFQTAFTFSEFWDSPEPILGLRPLSDECVDALLDSAEGFACLSPGLVGNLAVAPLHQPGLHPWNAVLDRFLGLGVLFIEPEC